jgi:hypothetical protein
MSPDRDQWYAVVNMEMNLRGSTEFCEFHGG